MDDIFEGLRENKNSFVIVLVLMLVIIILSILNIIFGNKNENIDMEGVVTSFAEIYYEELYYPNVKSAYSSNYAEKLGQAAENGVKLTLRQIVNIFEDVDVAKFYKEGNYCNFLQTYAIIYPKHPYGIEDYEIKVQITCDEEL